jgi:DNA-binding transcriptional LysR family regulator
MDRFDAMTLFIRVAHAGSFSKAADQLGLARSVVTRHIAALEKHLGIRLFNRTTRSLALTPSGQVYLGECEAIVSRIETLEADITKESLSPRGLIRMSIPISYGLAQVFPCLTAFMQQHPEVEFDIDFSDQRINLSKEGMDLALRITGELGPRDRAQKISETRVIVVASPTYLTLNGTPVNPEALKNHICLHYAHSQQNEPWTFQTRDTFLSLSLKGRLSVNNGEALAHAAAQGLGIARLPEFIVRPWIDRGALRPILGDYPCPPLGIFAVLPEHRQEPRRVRLLIDFLKRNLSS